MDVNSHVQQSSSPRSGLLGARSAVFTQFAVVFAGLLLTLSIFFVLESFIQGVIEGQQVETSKDFVEDFVEDVYGAGEVLQTLARVAEVSDQRAPETLRKILADLSEGAQPYAQILWFYQMPEGSWAVQKLLSTDQQNLLFDEEFAQNRAAITQQLLKAGAAENKRLQLLTEVIAGGPRQVRQSPKILAAPILLSVAAQSKGSAKAFLLGVLDPAALFNEVWLRSYRDLNYLRLQHLQPNITLFELLRGGDDGPLNMRERQVYEFPFAQHNLEVSNVFAQDKRTQFLGFFPYIIAAFGVCFVAAAYLYTRHHTQQGLTLKALNEALDQKNFELGAEEKERERLNRAVQDAETKGRAVIDAVSDIILEMDQKGKIIFLNKAWRGMTGFEVQQTQGQSLDQILHPQDTDKVMESFGAMCEGHVQDFRHYTQLRLSDGTFRAVELSVRQVQDAASGGMRIIGAFTDIEERRRAERALSDAEKKYRSIVENAAGGIFQLTQEGLYLSANPAFARILRYDTPEQLLREVKNANEQLYVDVLQRQAFYKKLSLIDEPLSHEVQMRCRDDAVIWVRESVRAVQDSQGQLLFFEGSIEDVTQRKESENAVRDAQMRSDLANRAKSEFLSNMSHELRTPLNSIIGFSEMIKNEVYGKIEQTQYWEYARDIHSSGTKLLQVINEILDISKIEAGERQLNEGVVNLSNVIESALDLLQQKIKNGKMVITKSLDSVPDIIGEELAIKQILLNLLSNAVKFTPDQGRITISGHVHRDGRLHISITDTGIGLDEAEIKKVLSPFGQIDSTFNREGSGTGLGLTLVDALIKLHGGDFELFSQKGIGTTATIIFPSDRIVDKSPKSLNNLVEKMKNNHE